LRQGVQGISELITVHGLINVDFADVRSVMENAGSALMGIGFGSGENRAVEAARAAVDSPLLEMSIEGAKGVLFNITGGNDMSMFEVDEAARIVTEAADSEANIIFGAVVNNSFAGEIKVTVIATGFDDLPAEDFSPDSNLKRVSRPNSQGDDDRKLPKSEDDLEIPAFMRKTLKK
jgi:cell division protein FtsZ